MNTKMAVAGFAIACLSLCFLPLSASYADGGSYVPPTAKSGAAFPGTHQYGPGSEKNFGDGPPNQNGSNSGYLDSGELGLYGPLSFGFEYSDEFGFIFHSKYLQGLNPQNAIGLEFDVGPRENREAATWGFALNPTNRFKITGERLEQKMLFDFYSGSVKKFIPQYAGGGAFQHIFENSRLHDITLGGYYSDAESKNLAPKMFVWNGLDYWNYRRIAGARAYGFDVGTHIFPWDGAEISAKLNYDDVRYPIRYAANFDPDKSQFGDTITFDQLLFHNRLKLSLLNSQRAIYDEYKAGVSVLALDKPGTAFTVGVNGMHLVNHNAQPDDTRVMLDFSLAWGGTGRNFGFIPPEEAAQSIVAWTNRPAVHMDAVLAGVDQKKVLAYAVSSYGFNPAALNVVGGEMFSTQGDFHGQNLTYSYVTNVSGAPNLKAQSGLPAWMTFDPTTQILSGTAPNVSETTVYTVTVTAHNAAGATSQSFVLTVAPNYVTFTQTINDQVPAVFILDRNYTHLSSGAYETTPPGQIPGARDNFEVKGKGVPVSGTFAYIVNTQGNEYDGAGCKVSYSVNKNGTITMTATPIAPSPGKEAVLCQTQNTNGKHAFSTLTIVAAAPNTGSSSYVS